jgi:hypothetical protein
MSMPSLMKILVMLILLLVIAIIPIGKIMDMLLNFLTQIMGEHPIILMELMVAIEIPLKKLLKVLLLARLSRMKISRIS